MLLVRLWNYLRGYVIIVVKGYFIEKFLNICTHRQILLWDIKRREAGSMTMGVSIKGFRSLRPIARKTRCRVGIVKKRGLPFILNRYRRRKTFVLGAILFVVLIFVMTSFVWSIEITGNKELDQVFIRDALSRNGIRTGILKYNINTDKAVEGMMLGVAKLSWISIDIKGTIVRVQLRERKDLPSMVPKNIPCDIVALRDGMIRQIIVTDGIEAAAVGDTVKKGQLLVSGRIPVKDDKDKFRLVHAMGTVMARTWYEEKCPVRLKYTEKVRTGRVVTNYTLSLFSQKLRLFGKRAGYADYDTVEEKHQLRVGRDLVFPFEIITDRYYETEPVNFSLNEEEARKKASDEAYRKLMETVPPEASIVKSGVKFIEDEDNGLMADVTVECIENIGIAKVIGGN